MTPAEIQAARKRLGLNTADFGAKLGVSGRTVEGWEQGKHQPTGPALVLLRKLAKPRKATTPADQ